MMCERNCLASGALTLRQGGATPSVRVRGETSTALGHRHSCRPTASPSRVVPESASCARRRSPRSGGRSIRGRLAALAATHQHQTTALSLVADTGTWMHTEDVVGSGYPRAFNMLRGFSDEAEGVIHASTASLDDGHKSVAST